MGEDTGIKMLAREPIQEEKEGEEESVESSEEEPDFLELNEATQKATKKVRLEDNPPDLLGQSARLVGARRGRILVCQQTIKPGFQEENRQGYQPS